MPLQRTVPVVLAFLVAAGPLVCEVGTAQAAPPRSTAVPIADWRFMRSAVAQGRAAIAAGRLASAKAADPAVADFGAVLTEEHLVLDHRLALLSLLKQVPLPVQAARDDRKALAALKPLAGSTFDAAFLVRAAALEDRVVRLFQAEAASRSADPALRALATEFLPRLQAQLRVLDHLHQQGTTSD